LQSTQTHVVTDEGVCLHNKQRNISYSRDGGDDDKEEEEEEEEYTKGRHNESSA
jgi:hypothetical protein